MLCLWKDKGQIWSCFAWRNVLTTIPEEIIPGMTYVLDKWLLHLDPFYHNMIAAYVNLNVLARGLPSEKLYPKNLWACQENKIINTLFIRAGYITIQDLPLINNSIDYLQIQQVLKTRGIKHSVWLVCTSLQEKFALAFGGLETDRDFPYDIIKTAKSIFYKSTWKPCTLMKWELALQIPQLTTAQTCLVFKRMLTNVKISKLRDRSFKILHRILATPHLIFKICKDPKIAICQWCGDIANQEHILLHCPVIRDIKDDLIIKLGDICQSEWIFGTKDADTSQIIVVINFAVYKAHILAVSGYIGMLFEIVEQTLQCFALLIRAIRTFDLC